MAQRMTQLEYAKEIAGRYGKDAPVTWLTVGELIDLLDEKPTGKRVIAIGHISPKTNVLVADPDFIHEPIVAKPGGK